MLCRTCKTASSTPRPLLYANCKGSRKSARRFCNYDSTTLSKTFMMADVRATGRKSFTTFTVVFFDTGIIQEVFHKAGIEHWDKDWLKITHKMEQSCSAYVFNRPGLILTGPAALPAFVLSSSLSTSWGLWPSAFRPVPLLGFRLSRSISSHLVWLKSLVQTNIKSV